MRLKYYFSGDVSEKRRRDKKLQLCDRQNTDIYNSMLISNNEDHGWLTF